MLTATDEFEFQAEAENRIRNLMWTVSGDYALDTKVDTESYFRSKYICLYDAVKQGAFARFFDKNEFGMYLVKKGVLRRTGAATDGAGTAVCGRGCL